MAHVSFEKNHALNNNANFLRPGKQTQKLRKICNRERKFYEDNALDDTKGRK